MFILFIMQRVSYLLLFIFLFSLKLSFAQSYSGAGNTSYQKKGIVKGFVHESFQNQPMEYTNVVLYNEVDSSMVNGMLTSSDGSFVIQDVPVGKYYIVFNFVGFDKKKISGIVITPDSLVQDMGTVTMQTSTTQLKEVTIMGDKAPVEYKIDKKIVNVSQNLSSAGGSVVNALENVPSVDVDIDGNVKVRGSENFTVLIDGKPSLLKGSDALNQIPASAVENVEIITNPSAKYDPEGTSGIINVVMKKSTKPGLSGAVNLTIGVNDKYKGDFLLNLKVKKFNFFTGMNYNNMTFHGTGTSEKVIFDSINSYSNSSGKRDFKLNDLGIKAGLDYYLTKKTTVSLSGFYEISNRERNFYLNNINWSEFDYANRQYSKNNNLTSDDENSYSVTFDYSTKFNNSGHELSGMLYYSEESSDELQHDIFYNTNSNWYQTDAYPYEALAKEGGPSKNIRGKLDYSYPLSADSKLEAGYQGRLENQMEDYTYTEFDTATGSWIENDLYSNSMDYSQNTQSLYGMYSGKLYQLEYQAGLRVEYINRSIIDQLADKPYKVDRWDFFPTLHLSYQLPRENQLQLSYTRRTNRPSGWRLEPFVSYMNSSTMRKGNPDLKPEYISSFDLSYLKSFKKLSFSLDGYYRITDAKITQTQTLYHVGDTLSGGYIIQPPQVSIDSSIILNEYNNLDKDYSMGIELMINSDIAKWFKITATGNVFYYKIEGYVDTSFVTNTSTNWNLKINTTFKITPSTKLQLSGYYNGPSVNAQGTTEASFYSNAALRQDFFKRKLSLTVEFRDMFGSAKYEFNTNQSGFSEHRVYKREPQVLMFTLSYLINNYKADKKSRNRTEDEMNIGNGGGEF